MAARELLLNIKEIQANTPDLTGAICREIPVESLMLKYGVENPRTQEAIRAFPTLAYLLGRVTSESQRLERVDEGPNKGKSVDAHILIEGSGMFNLTNPEDAKEWKGIFNHIVGSARIIYQGIEVFKSLSPEQRLQFVNSGFDFTVLDAFTPELGALYMLTNHAGRRRMDEHNWYGFSTAPHIFNDSFPNTVNVLSETGAHPALLQMMNEENHLHLLPAGKNGLYRDVALSILLAGDWQWGQELTDLHTRFEQMAKSGRLPKVMLDVLEGPIIPFMETVKEVLGADFWQRAADPRGSFAKHELLIREGYTLPSGLTVNELFPAYAQTVERN